MLKSTYVPSPNLANQPPLLPGWTEHKAPTGHTYYYNAETKESTYKRPADGAAAPPTPSQPSSTTNPAASFLQYQSVAPLSNPAVANAYMSQYARSNSNHPPHGADHGRDSHPSRGRDRPDRQARPPQHRGPTDKPRSKVPIPGCDPWILVYTKYGRRFAYNPAKNTSYWRIPDKLKPAILEFDQARIRDKATGKDDVEEQRHPPTPNKTDAPAGAELPKAKDGAAAAAADDDYDSSEYEEVEVTDDEGDGDGDGDGEHGKPSKRQRTEEPVQDDRPVEFSEADIAYQLQAMGGDYAMDNGDHDDGNMDDWSDGGGDEAAAALSDEDAAALFKDLLNDFNINPYSSWDKLIEEGKIFDDGRYAVLASMRARRDVWEEWSREKIRELKEIRSREEKKDPRIPYMAFLEERATPKLYWPEFKRKYRKEPPMKDAAVPDKDREKWYREYIGRLKLPEPTRKSDFTALLKSMPLSVLNNATPPSHLPPQILVDLRYVSLSPKVRDPLIEAYIQTLPPPPEDLAQVKEDEAAQKAKQARAKRESALRDHERAVEEEKQRQQKRLAQSKARLRDEERELQLAMEVSKKGLHSQLLASRSKE